jgi:hypothetical protein
MRKTISISIMLMIFFVAAQAQKKIIYEDTSLLQKDEPVISAPTEDFNADDSIAYKIPVEEDVKDEPETTLDTTLYKNYLNFPYDSVKKWRNQKEYGYTKYLDSLLKALNKEEEKKQREPPEPPGFFSRLLGSGIVGFLLWAFVIFFIGFILYRLFLSEGGFRRRSKSMKDTLPGVEEEIITNESDFDALIRQALQNSNYRQAIRYQYLRTLHLLAAKNLVALAPDKTNYQYVTEIANRDLQQAFAGLTLNYEYVWYGEFEIDKEIYDKIETGFRQLNQKL